MCCVVLRVFLELMRPVHCADWTSPTAQYVVSALHWLADNWAATLGLLRSAWLVDEGPQAHTRPLSHESTQPSVPNSCCRGSDLAALFLGRQAPCRDDTSPLQAVMDVVIKLGLVLERHDHALAAPMCTPKRVASLAAVVSRLEELFAAGSVS